MGEEEEFLRGEVGGLGFEGGELGLEGGEVGFGGEEGGEGGEVGLFELERAKKIEKMRG